MKTEFPPDPELGRLLQSWQIDVHDDPGMVVRVRERMQQSSSARVGDELAALVGWLGRPFGSIALVTTFAVLGLVLAERSASGQRDARLDLLVTEYVRSIDPILMTEEGHVHGTFR